MTAFRTLIVLSSLLTAVGCGTRDDVSRSESFRHFSETVVPVLETRCGLGCHGVRPDDYARFMADPQHRVAFYFPLDPENGRVPRDEATLLAAFAAATGGAQDGHAGRLDYAEAPRFSRLLRVPLVEEYGGLPHRGLDVFYAPDDNDYQTLARWVALEIARRPTEAAALPEPALYFREHVLPVLTRNGCFLSACHGPTAFNDLKLTPPLSMLADESLQAGFSRAMVLENRAAMLGRVTRLANLGGDLRHSRLIVKNLPLEQGGIHQRGGNNQFFESFDDPDVGVLLEWLRRERAGLAANLQVEGQPVAEADVGRLQGIVFIRGPRHTPRRFFDLDPFYPGSDIYLWAQKRGETPEQATNAPLNLTGAWHSGPIEIQGLDVRYDGRALVFAMRRHAEEGFRLYELRLKPDLSGAEGLRQISFAPVRQAGGDLVHHIDPVYVPGPSAAAGWQLDQAAVAYASNEAGSYARTLPAGLIGEADGGDARVVMDAQRTERPGSFTGRQLSFVAGPNAGEWRRVRAHEANPGGGARLVLDRPLAQAPDRRSVYVLEQTEAEVRPAYDIWRVVPGVRDSARRLTYTSAQERRPTVRSSGEVMFTSVRNVGYQADRPVYNGAIYRVQAGGFDYHVHGGNRSRYPLYADARELPSGLEIRLALDPRNLWGGGSLLLADHGLGINAEPENPVDGVPLAEGEGADYALPPRYVPAQRPLFAEPGVVHTGVSSGGAFRDPYPLSDGQLLVARAAGPVDHLDPGADPDWDLYLLRFNGSPQTGAPRMLRLAAAASDMSEFNARPITVRLKEPATPHQRFSPHVKTAELREDQGVRLAPPGTPGEIECFDYPLLQAFLTDFAPVGERHLLPLASDPLEAGASGPRLRYVRIVAEDPPGRADLEPVGAPDSLATRVGSGVHTRKRIVAEVPLEPDGSFYAQVPSETPLIIQGLDERRRAVHTMNRWFYVHPGERLTFSIPRPLFATACAGCHGALTGRPQDALGPPDLVTASSRVMANWDPAAAARRKPYTVKAGLSIDFARDVQPILDRKCVSCHSAQRPAGGLVLAGTPTRHYTAVYEALHRLTDPGSGNYAAKKYINEREALSSESALIAHLLGEAGGGPHPAEAPLSEAELTTLIRWIDLGATFRGGGS